MPANREVDEILNLIVQRVDDLWESIVVLQNNAEELGKLVDSAIEALAEGATDRGRVGSV
jgi:hypothetical protein